MVAVNERDIEILRDLTKIIGPSGCEKDVQKYWRKLMRPYVDRTRVDTIGNCYAERDGKKGLPKLMFNAHADTVGFQVIEVEEGFVFTKDMSHWGQVDHRCLPGSEARVVSSKTGNILTGNFIPPRPFHILTSDELEESPERYDTGIDLGVVDEGKSIKKVVSVGDYVVFGGEFRRFGSKRGFVSSHSLDNRLGLWLMYQTAKKLKGVDCPISFVSTVSEESGNFVGAGVSARAVKPNVSITLDVTVSTDHVKDMDDGARAKQFGIISLGKGPVLPRGPGVNEEVYFLLRRLAGKRSGRSKIPYQVEVSGGGTENTKIIGVGGGIRTAGIFVPLRNMHSPIETAYLGDVNKTINLCVRACEACSDGKFK